MATRIPGSQKLSRDAQIVLGHWNRCHQPASYMFDVTTKMDFVAASCMSIMIARENNTNNTSDHFVQVYREVCEFLWPSKTEES